MKYVLTTGRLTDDAETPVGEFETVDQAKAMAEAMAAKLHGAAIAPWIEPDHQVWQLGGEGAPDASYWMIRAA